MGFGEISGRQRGAGAPRGHRGGLLVAIHRLGWDATTDVLVVSAHGHRTVAGDPERMPPRELEGAATGAGTVGKPSKDGQQGYAVSGDVRSADILHRAGFANVYDGGACLYDPVMSGIKAGGAPVYSKKVDSDGSACGKAGSSYTTGNYRVPAKPPRDAIIIAANGGSEYFYVPSQ